jgi:hypothetical protein
MQCKQLVAILSVMCAGLLVTEVNAQSQNYRLQTLLTGTGRCLDIINDGENNKPIMAECGNFSGQFWSLPQNP